MVQSYIGEVLFLYGPGSGYDPARVVPQLVTVVVHTDLHTHVHTLNTPARGGGDMIQRGGRGSLRQADVGSAGAAR